MTPAAGIPEGAIQVPAGGIQWKAGAPNLPAGAQVAVLEGDPKKAGLFTMRLKLKAGSRIEPHWHPRDERVTVISGVVMVGFGDRFDTAQGARFGAGSFYVNPAGSHHYVWFLEETVVQITGVGPWELRPVNAP